MTDLNLVSGDLVVDLAGLLRTSAVLAGATSCAVSFRILKRSVLWIVAAVVLGGIGGFLFGSLIGPLFFSAPSGEVMVVKLGPGAFWTALKAGLIGGVSAGVLAGLVPSLIISRTSQFSRLVGINVAVGIIIGAISAYIATRP